MMFQIMMAGHVTRRSERRSVDNLTGDALANKELELFNKLAAAIGDSLEAVCNMQERERSELITVLGLESCEDTVKILRPGGDHIEEPEFDNSAVTSSEVKTNKKKSSLIEESGLGSQGRLDDLDDDLKVVAIKKRKRSLSGERNSERKRKSSADNFKSERIDFTKFLQTKDGDIFKDDFEKKDDINTLLDEVSESNDAKLGNDDESMSLLGEPSRTNTIRVNEIVENEMPSSSPIIRKKVKLISKVKIFSKKSSLSFSQIQEQLDDSDDNDESSNQQEIEQSWNEVLKEGDEELNEENCDIIHEKKREINRILISKCNLLPVDLTRLSIIVDSAMCPPKHVLGQDSLPVVTAGSLDMSNVLETPCNDSESTNNLFNYFQAVNKIQSKGLVHGASVKHVSWTKLLPKKNTRGKTQEKGILMKFFADKDGSSENGIIYDSSDEFEDDICLKKENKEELSHVHLLQTVTSPRSDHTSLKQLESSGWMGKYPSSLTKDSTLNINRLKLPKGKRKLQLCTPEKYSEPGSDLQIVSSSAEVKSGSTQEGLNRSMSINQDSHLSQSQEPMFGTEATNTSKDVSGSDDDSIEIVLEVASKENTPSKPRESPGEDPASPEVRSPAIATGDCPLCGREMTIPLLVKHSAICDGPEQGPSLRNSGGRERRKF